MEKGKGDFVKVIFSIGSNMGDRLNYLKQAIKGLAACGKIQSISSVVESEPWGYDDSKAYLNAVLVLETDWQPERVYRLAAEIENGAGRRRNETTSYTSRTLDIDILYYGSHTISSDMLEIPHPRLHLRNFVLEPLVEVEPDFRHPVLGKTSKELFKNSPDSSRVSYFSSFHHEKL